MKLELGSESFARASVKAGRLLPEIRVRASGWHSSFDVRVCGSGRVWYTCGVWSSVDGGVSCGCSCAAGDKKLHCYHVAAAWQLYLLFAENGVVPDILSN